MRADEIVEVIMSVVEDRDAALAAPGGKTALVVEAAVAAELESYPAYRQSWRQFRASPRAYKPLLIDALQAVLRRDAALSARLDALMTAYRQDRSDATVITTDGAYVGGNVSVENGDFVGRDQVKTVTHYQGADPSAIAQAFATLYTQVAETPDLSPQDKADVQAELRDVEQELKKGEHADEGFIRRRLRNIQRMAPDILDVVLTTFANPILGLGMVAKKIAAKMKVEADAGSAPSES